MLWETDFLALKGRNIPAQGNALGNRYINDFLALKGRHIYVMCRPFRAKILIIFNPGRCPGLVYYALSGLRNHLPQMIYN